MIIWLASYPRSGNTFFRLLLHRRFGFQTHSVYSLRRAAQSIPEDTRRLMRLVGQPGIECDIGRLHADSGTHFVKTHDLPKEGDDSPAVVLVRDGRDAVVSYAHFLLKTEHGAGQSDADLFEKTLRRVITSDGFGGWSGNVKAWISRVGHRIVVRYEDLIEDSLNISADTLRRLGLRRLADGGPLPSFHELRESVPWFFRNGRPGSWRHEMPAHLHELFLERHGDTLHQLGYSALRADSDEENGQLMTIRRTERMENIWSR